MKGLIAISNDKKGPKSIGKKFPIEAVFEQNGKYFIYFCCNNNMPMFKKKVRRIVIPNYKNDIQKLEKTLKLVVNKLENVENELFEIKSNRKLETEITLSNSGVTGRRQHFTWSQIQLLIMLRDGKATSTEFAVSSEQLRKTFSIDKSERTIRNTLKDIIKFGYVGVIGSKPKRFFITPAGLMFLEQQQRQSLHFR